MMRIAKTVLGCALLLCLAVPALAGTPPVVSNVVAAQREGTFLVDIAYDLADAENDPCTVTLLLSVDAGLTYPVELVTLTGDFGPDQMPGPGKTVVWDAGVDFPEFFGTECSIRVVAEDGTSPTVKLVVLLDRSGSMAGQTFDDARAELGAFFQAPGAADVFAALYCYPCLSPLDICAYSSYASPLEPIQPIPVFAAQLIDAMAALEATGNAPTQPALYGSLNYASAIASGQDEKIAVVLLADGPPTACDTAYSSLVSLAQSAYSSTGVMTYVVALQGAAVAEFDAVAAAGGTGSAYDITSDTLQLSETMAAIVADAGTR